MLYEVITLILRAPRISYTGATMKQLLGIVLLALTGMVPATAFTQDNNPDAKGSGIVITSYSIHYTKLYESAKNQKLRWTVF